MVDKPYLQLRWEIDPESMEFLCSYEMILPLEEFDIRREIWEDGEEIGSREFLTVPMASGKTRRFGRNTPCLNKDGTKFADAPFRNGAHAKWDSKRLGDLPIFVMDLDGELHEYKE